MAYNKVKLESAWKWECPNCEAINCQSGIVVEFSQEDREAMEEEYGDQEFETGNYVAMPEVVECIKCGMEFDTEDE